MQYDFKEYRGPRNQSRYTPAEQTFIQEAAQYLLENPEISRVGLCKWSVEQGYIKRPVSSLCTKIWEAQYKLKNT